MADELRIVGPFKRLTGYSKLTRSVLRAALEAGYRVEARESDYRVRVRHFSEGRELEQRRFTSYRKGAPIPDCQREEVERCARTRVHRDAPTILIQLPPTLSQWHEYSRGPRIGYTMLESDRLAEEWRLGCYGVDLLLAPSRYVERIFQYDCPEQETGLLPCPVDDRLWRDEQTRIGIGGRLPAFLFFSIFNNVERKQWRVLMQAFAEEFGPEEDIGLMLKPGRVAEVAELAGWLNTRTQKRRIVVIDHFLPEDALNAWYRRCQCYALVGAEGFGLPYVEAAMCGIPSVALDMGGAADAVTEDTGYLVPGEMRQVFGSFAHVYSSKHRFPAPRSIEDVRKALRAAYEDGAAKGQAARERALAEFTPAAVAPILREQVDRAKRIFEGRTRMWSMADRTPKWAVCLGDGFGDALATIGNVQRVMADTGADPLTVLHYGWQESVSEFMRHQPCIQGVHRIQPESKDVFHETSNDSGGRYARPYSSWIHEILKDTDIDPRDVARTQVHWPWGTWKPNRPKDVRLSEDAVEWAARAKAEFGEFILVQPYSTSSVGIGAHWHGWHMFLWWLVQRCAHSHRLVFCGLNKIPDLARPNVIDLIGKTPSMQHVFALAEVAKGSITTCNALANWAAVKRTRPALVAANAAIAHPWMFWYRFMNVKPVTLMPYQTSIREMEAAAEKWLEGLTK